MQYIDPNALYQKSLQPWDELWNDCVSIYDNLKSILDRAILLPDHEAQMPIVTAYALINPKYAFTLPILFLWGRSGSAKTQILKIVKELHECEKIYGPSSTFAALRNELKRQYWLDQDAGYQRDGAMILFDNAWESTFLNDTNLFAMLLTSYERSNATVSMSSQVLGENSHFNTFSSKIISSVQLFNNPALNEIQRRLVVIRCKKIDEFKPDDFDGTEFDVDDVLDTDSIDWDGFNLPYFKFWNDLNNCRRYAELRGKLTNSELRMKKKIINSFSGWLNNDLWKILVDLVCTLVVTGGAKDEIHAFEILDHFYTTLNAKKGQHQSALEQLVLNWLNPRVEQLELVKAKVEIPKTQLVKHIKEHSDSLDDRFSQAKLNDLMINLGWISNGTKWIRG